MAKASDVAALLATVDLDPDVYADYLTGILDAGRDGPLQDALEQVRQVVIDANPAISEPDVSAFADALARIWQSRLAQEREEEEESARRRAVETQEGLERLKRAMEAKPAAQSASAGAPRLTEEEKRIILQTSYEPEAEEESTEASLELGGGAAANRLRVQQQRQKDQTYRAEQHKKQQAQSKAAEKAGKQAREEKKAQRRGKA